MASDMVPGDIVKTTAVNVHFENQIAKGHYGMKAEKGHYLVFLFLGTTKRDGTEPLDIVATVKEMGWTPDELIAAQHDRWLDKHPDARTPFGPVMPEPKADPLRAAVEADLASYDRCRRRDGTQAREGGVDDSRDADRS